MKIVYNIYVAVRKLWNAIFGKNGDGSQLVIPGRISGASGDVTVGDGLNLTNNVMKSTVPVVSANPETGESDPELTGLMIGSNKYKVPSGGGGGTVYKHTVKLSLSTNVEPFVLAVIYTNSETAFASLANVAKWLTDNNYNDARWAYPIYAQPTGDVNIYFGIYSFNSTTIFVTLTKLDLTNGTHDEQNKSLGTFISDTVVEL